MDFQDSKWNISVSSSVILDASVFEKSSGKTDRQIVAEILPRWLPWAWTDGRHVSVDQQAGSCCHIESDAAIWFLAILQETSHFLAAVRELSEWNADYDVDHLACKRLFVEPNTAVRRKQSVTLTGRSTTGPPSRGGPWWVTLHMRVLQTTTTDASDRC